MTTYEFYRDVCGGRAEESAFASAVGTAEAVIRALLYPTVPEELDAAAADVLGRAVCAQADYGLAAEKAGTVRIRSESLGDRSVTYETEAAGVLSIRGVPVSPQALLLLGNAGLLSRWV